MTLLTSNNQRSVNVGTSDIWHSLYSTVCINLKRKTRHISLAVRFLKSGTCSSADAMETARQFNLIRDMLSQFSPNDLVYDLDNPKGPAPWDHKISPVVTSCANFYTTADGGDLLYEIVSILCYAGIAGVSVSAQ